MDDKIVKLSLEELKSIVKNATVLEEIQIDNFSLTCNAPTGFNGLYYNLTIQYNKFEILKCFAKCVPQNTSHLEFIKGTKLLLKEFEFYGKIQPLLEKYINYKLPTAICYYQRFVQEDQLKNIIVMNDLALESYTTKNVRKALNFNDCSNVLESLAKLHAASIIFKFKTGKNMSEICEYSDEALWVTDKNNPTYPWVKSAIDTIEEVIENIPDLYKRLKKETHAMVWKNAVYLTKLSNKYNNVICHGDIWLNNIMFNDKQGDVKLIDFQVYRITPPILDVLMFLYLSTTRQFRTEYKDLLINNYIKNFISIIKEHGYDFPESELQEQVKEFELFGLISAVGYLPMNLLPPEARENKVKPTTEGARDFDVISDFLKSRSVQVWKGLKMDNEFYERLTDAIDELFTFIGL